MGGMGDVKAPGSANLVGYNRKGETQHAESRGAHLVAETNAQPNHDAASDEHPHLNCCCAQGDADDEACSGQSRLSAFLPSRLHGQGASVSVWPLHSGQVQYSYGTNESHRASGVSKQHESTPEVTRKASQLTIC